MVRLTFTAAPDATVTPVVAADAADNTESMIVKAPAAATPSLPPAASAPKATSPAPPPVTASAPPAAKVPVATTVPSGRAPVTAVVTPAPVAAAAKASPAPPVTAKPAGPATPPKPDGTGALASGTPPPAGTTLALVWKPTMERLEEAPPAQHDYDVIDIAALGNYSGRYIRLLTSTGKKVEGRLIGVDSTAVGVRVKQPGGMAELQVPRSVIVEIQLPHRAAPDNG
jgi:hypothetical protein